MSETSTTDVETLANEIAESIDFDETIELLQELVQIESPYFEEEEAAEFVYDWLDERDLSPEYHHVNEPGPTGFEGDNLIAGVR